MPQRGRPDVLALGEDARRPRMAQHHTPSCLRELAHRRLPIVGSLAKPDLGDDGIDGAVDDVVLVPNAAVEPHRLDLELLRAIHRTRLSSPAARTGRGTSATSRGAGGR